MFCHAFLLLKLLTCVEIPYSRSVCLCGRWHCVLRLCVYIDPANLPLSFVPLPSCNLSHRLAHLNAKVCSDSHLGELLIFGFSRFAAWASLGSSVVLNDCGCHVHPPVLHSLCSRWSAFSLRKFDVPFLWCSSRDLSDLPIHNFPNFCPLEIPFIIIVASLPHPRSDLSIMLNKIPGSCPLCDGRCFGALDYCVSFGCPYSQVYHLRTLCKQICSPRNHTG